MISARDPRQDEAANGSLHWRTEPNGCLLAEVGPLQLVVQKSDKAGGPTRFLVQRRTSGDRPHELLGSGTREDARAAMAAAEWMAVRFVPPAGA